MKKKLIVFWSILLVVFLTLFMMPTSIFADTSPSTGIWVNIDDPTGTPSTWNVHVDAYAFNGNGNDCVISVDGNSTTQLITSDDWAYTFDVSGLSAGDYQARVAVMSGVEVLSEITWNFTLFDHTQGITVSADGQTVTWSATDVVSGNKWASLGVSRILPDYHNYDDLLIWIADNPWSFTKTYDLPEGEYIAWLSIQGNDTNIEWTIVDGARTAIKQVEKPWVRDHPMTCYQVWVNENNQFEMVFWWPYKNNNWVRIYNMSGNLVYETNMSLNNPHIVVDLPDGMYTVKTFHDQPEPLQVFVIGKP
jgi:hypothetical protein